MRRRFDGSRHTGHDRTRATIDSCLYPKVAKQSRSVPLFGTYELPILATLVEFSAGRGRDRETRLAESHGFSSFHRGFTMSELLDPIVIGDLRLPNRLIMAPLTRCRAGERRVPNALMAEYYAQRATAGLIVSEATSVTPMGVGYAGTPGIWSREQVEGWKLVTRAVHAAGGRILLQLWHVGRISDPSFLDGALPVAPSAIAARGHVSLLRPQRPFATPRALEPGEIPGIVDGLSHGCGECTSRRIRRRRDSRCQWLPARPVPAGQLRTIGPTSTAARSKTGLV